MASSSNRSEHPPDLELRSWKGVAAYLGKTVRTVQRWEREEGLPVIRHLHEKRGTVYASTEDIDAWLAVRSVVQAQTMTNPQRLLLGMGFAAALFVGFIGHWLIFGSDTSETPESALSFNERPWIMVLPLENLTDDPLLTDALDYSLRQGLVAAHRVNIASQQRIRDTLRLMRRDPDQRLDLELALEASRRDSQITKIVAGRIQQVGGEYTLGLEAIDTSSGQVSEAVFGKSPEIENLIGLASGLADRLAHRISEQPKTDPPLESVTTNSLQAAKLYTTANRMLVDENLGGGSLSAAAEELLFEAIAEDPEFASAHLLLAWSIARQGRPRVEFMPHADRALELVDTATENERFFIRASHLGLKGEHEASIPVYQALINRYPDHFWGVSNLTYALLSERRLAENADMWVPLANLRPTSMRLNFRAYFYLRHMGDPRADALAARIRNLASPEDWTGQQGHGLFWIETSAAHRAWLAGDLPAFASEQRRLEVLKDRLLSKQARQRAEADLAFMELALGRLKTGWRRLETLGEDFDFRDEVYAIAAHLSGNRQALDGYLDVAVSRVEAQQGHPFSMIPLLLARTGRLAESEELLDQLGLTIEARTATLGALALARGNYQDVVDILGSLHEKMLFVDGSYYLATEILAEAYVKLGMPERARRVLEIASNQRYRIADFSGITAWIQNQLVLANLLRKMGEAAQAAKVEAELSRLLELGDEDHPVKRWLAGRDTS